MINRGCLIRRFLGSKNLNPKGGKDGYGKKTGKEEDDHKKENDDQEDDKEVRLLPLELA